MPAVRPWSGGVFLGSGWLLYSGAVGSASLHRHHAAQVLVARSGVGEIDDGQAAVCRARAILVAADAPHAMRCATLSAYLLYLESGSRIAQRLEASQGPSLHALHDGALEDLLSEPEPASLESARRIALRMVGLLAPAALVGGARPRHPSVRRAMALMPALIEQHGNELRLRAVAAAVGRSPEGFSRVFNDEVGMSVPAYIRWARLRFVARSLARGLTLTDAAQDAGFSDSAHLSRVFRDTFGARPSDLAACTRWAVGDVELS